MAVHLCVVALALAALLTADRGEWREPGFSVACCWWWWEQRQGLEHLCGLTPTVYQALFWALKTYQ